MYFTYFSIQLQGKANTKQIGNLLLSGRSQKMLINVQRELKSNAIVIVYNVQNLCLLTQVNELIGTQNYPQKDHPLDTRIIQKN